MPSIMQRLFAPAPPAPAPAPMAPVNQGANPANVANQPSGTAANGPAQPIPLDEFNDLWKDAPVDPKNVDPFSTPLLNMDQTKFNETVSKLNFTDGITQEQVAKAMQDPGEFLKLLNSTAQKAFAASTQLSTNAIEGSHKTNNERINQTLGSKIKAHQVTETRSDNAILNHSAAAPILDSIKQQILAKNPSLSAQQVHAKAEKMLTDLGEGLVQNKQQAATPQHDPYDFSDM